jgi:hypothetical protein
MKEWRAYKWRVHVKGNPGRQSTSSIKYAWMLIYLFINHNFVCNKTENGESNILKDGVTIEI